MTDDTEKGRGRPREHTTEDVLRALQAIDSGDGVRTGEVAHEAGCSTRTALRRLKTLEENGQVNSNDVTERLKLWTVADD